MGRTGTNLPAVGEYNQTVVLDAIRRRPEGITRSELAALTALSGMTVTKVCRAFWTLVSSTSAAGARAALGKPAAVVKLNPDGGFAVGVHIDPAAVTYVLVDLSGKVRDHSRTGTPTAGDPSGGHRRDGERDRSAHRGFRRRQVAHPRASASRRPDPVNVEDGVLLNPPMMPNWHRVALRRSLAAATGLPVLLEKDATAAVVAELWFAGPAAVATSRSCTTAPVSAPACRARGEVVRGISSNAGDGGHITVDPGRGGVHLRPARLRRLHHRSASARQTRGARRRVSRGRGRRPRRHRRCGRGLQQAGGPRRGRGPRGDPRS